MTPGEDDPAYESELLVHEALCREFIICRERGDFRGSLLLCGAQLAQLAAIWKLSPPAGLSNPAELFEREEVSRGE
jgi:hypothetical protein